MTPFTPRMMMMLCKMRSCNDSSSSTSNCISLGIHTPCYVLMLYSLVCLLHPQGGRRPHFYAMTSEDTARRTGRRQYKEFYVRWCLLTQDHDHGGLSGHLFKYAKKIYTTPYGHSLFLAIVFFLFSLLLLPLICFLFLCL